MLAVTILSNSHDISFMNDRVALKLYACEKHLENLRQMELTYEVSQANKQELNHKRINLEIEIDCLILQMIGIIDCLLVQTNNKLGLGIPLHQLSIDRVIIRSAVEGLIAKPNSKDMYIVWSSTPRILNGLLWQLEHEDPSMYYKMVLPYQYGLEGPKPIYDLNQLNQAKLSPEWAREYECKYESSYGGVISPMAVDRCLQLGEEMAKTTPIDDWSIQTQYVMSIDMGYGSSNTAIILSRFVNGKVQIIYSKEFTHVDFRDLIDTIWNLRNKYPPKPDGLQNIIIDASGAELYTVLCHECGQNPSPKYLAEKQTWCKKINMPLESQLFVVPVPFSTRHQDLLGHLKWIIEEQDEEDGKAMVAIDKRFEEIVTSLRTAQATENSLDKNATAFDDTLDSLRLNLSYYRRSG